MKKLITILCLLISFTGTQAQLNGELLQKTIPAPSLSENLFNESTSQEITVYLPPSYNEVDYCFPTVYYLEGYYCLIDPFLFITGYDNLLSQNQLNELIVVVIEGCNRLSGSFYVNSIVGGYWEDYVIKDVVRYMDSHYRTIRKKQCRAITGHSIGGFGAINLAMRNPDIFNSLYSFAPTVVNEEGSKEWLVFKDEDGIWEYLNYVESLKADNTSEELARLDSTLSNQSNKLIQTLGYGAAFCPDTEGHVPFIMFPYSTNGDGELVLNDSIMNIWDEGCGHWDTKVEKYTESFQSYDTLIIDQGINDNYEYIVSGVNYLDNLFNSFEIEHSTIFFEGGHHDYTRYHQVMFPALSETLWRDSSRFKTETDILSFELNNQIQPAIIDTVNYNITAFVSNTSSLESLIPTIIVSDGARETPMSGTELDFSMGPIPFKVVSGDGQNQKIWMVQVNQISTSINDINNNLDCIIFPNPTSGIINIIGTSRPADIEIYNLKGQLIKSTNQVQNQIDISDLDQGIYIVHFMVGDKIFVRKLIKD